MNKSNLETNIENKIKKFLISEGIDISNIRKTKFLGLAKSITSKSEKFFSIEFDKSSKESKRQFDLDNNY